MYTHCPNTQRGQIRARAVSWLAINTWLTHEEDSAMPQGLLSAAGTSSGFWSAGGSAPPELRRDVLQDAADRVRVVVHAKLFGTVSSSVSAAAIASSAASSLTSTSGSAAYERPKMARVLASM